jgi:hypothetical protein
MFVCSSILTSSIIKKFAKWNKHEPWKCEMIKMVKIPCNLELVDVPIKQKWYKYIISEYIVSNLFAFLMGFYADFFLCGFSSNET